MVDRTIHVGLGLKATPDKFAEVRLHRGKHRIDETATKMRMFFHIGMYLIVPMHHLVLLMMCRYRNDEEETLGPRSSLIQVSHNTLTDSLV